MDKELLLLTVIEDIMIMQIINYFIWNRFATVAQQMSIVFSFDQQIRISRISMFFWNSQSNSIIVPNVRMYRSNCYYDDIIISNEITEITSNSPNRTDDG